MQPYTWRVGVYVQAREAVYELKRYGYQAIARRGGDDARTTVTVTLDEHRVSHAEMIIRRFYSAATLITTPIT